MPFNRSEQKVRVVHSYGNGSTIGLISPFSHMNVRYGIDSLWIVALDSGNFQVGLALSSGGTPVKKAYCHDLTIDATKAAIFGWPSTVDNHPVGLGHSGIWGPPDGVPEGTTTNSFVTLDGDGGFSYRF